MRLHVLHETRYFYNSPVYGMVMEARLRPCSDDTQFCQRHRLVVSPKTTIQEYSTFSDLTVHYWSLLKASQVIVISESVVDTHQRPLNPVEAPPAGVDQVDLYPYMLLTLLTESSPAIEEFAGQFMSLARQDWYQTALAVREAIHNTIKFEVGATQVQTTAAEALDYRRGVCQDFTHLMIACLRILGIPARYVSGYLNPDTTHEPPINVGGIMYQSMSQSHGMSQSMGQQSTYQQTMNQQSMNQQSMNQQSMNQQSMNQSQDGQSIEQGNEVARGEVSVRGTGASHAWCEVYLGSAIGWRGFDPANNLLIDEHYVRIGAGRDFNDITPMKGSHKGPAEENFMVSVSVKPVQ